MRKIRYRPERRRVVEDEIINHHEIKKTGHALAGVPVSTKSNTPKNKEVSGGVV